MLPQVVCGSCAHKLDEFHTFRELSHKSERLLEQFFQYANSLSGPKEVGKNKLNCITVYLKQSLTYLYITFLNYLFYSNINTFFMQSWVP